jgi:hypothetical protein
LASSRVRWRGRRMEARGRVARRMALSNAE